MPNLLELRRQITNYSLEGFDSFVDEDYSFGEWLICLKIFANR